MRRSTLRAAAVLVTTGALIAMGTSSALASPVHHDQHQQQSSVDVVGSGSSVTLSRSSVPAGSIEFHVSTTVPASSGNGSEITMFTPKQGATVATVFADFAEEFSDDPTTAAKGTRDLTKDAVFFGLADVTEGYPMTVTESLRPGTYYLIDAGTTPPTDPKAATQLTVTQGRYGHVDDGSQAGFTVRATSSDRFIAPRNWPHKGTLTFDNVSDTLHFMNLVRVQPHTTDAEVQQYFDSNPSGPPSFAIPDAPSGGNDVVSPGRSLQLTYDLPAGTYVLLCFVADDQTGMPHAMMGMHKVVVLH